MSTYAWGEISTGYKKEAGSEKNKGQKEDRRVSA